MVQSINESESGAGGERLHLVIAIRKEEERMHPFCSFRALHAKSHRSRSVGGVDEVGWLIHGKLGAFKLRGKLNDEGAKTAIEALVVAVAAEEATLFVEQQLI